MKIASRSRFWSLAALLAVDLVLFASTDPQEVPSFMLIIGFLMFTVTVYCLMSALLGAVSLYGVLSSEKRRHHMARVITGMLAGLVALQSIGQLSSRDIVVLLPLTIVAYLYFVYAKGNKAAPQSSISAN